MDLEREVAQESVFLALDYYFENKNNNRPYFLAGHSQGSAMITFILDEYMKEHPERYANMIAAYMIGNAPTLDWLFANPHLKFAQGADDTGVLISWNSEGPGNIGQFNLVVPDGAVAINPLNWSTDETYASIEENKGSLLPGNNGEWTISEGIADARLDMQRGSVIVESVDPELYAMPPEAAIFFGPESYHMWDYEFFYMNIRKNAELLLKAFLTSRYERSEKPSVENARIGVMIGSTNEVYVEMHYPNAKVERFNNYAESTAALLGKKIDYAMMDYTSALNTTKYNPELEIVSDFLTDEMLSLGTNKNNPELAEQVSGIVSRYLADGIMDEIISHWILEGSSDYEEIDTPKHEDAPVLRVAIISSREPTTFVLHNKYAGLDIELIDRIAYELGYRVEYFDMDLADVLEAMGSERMDMSLGMYATPEREEHILFSPPYFANPQVIISQK